MRKKRYLELKYGYNELHILLRSIKNEATVRQKNNVQVQHKKDTNMSNNIIQLHIITYISMILKGEYSIQYIK